TLLLLLLLNRATGAFWRSAFVAALFALHPMHVESVAWVSERKDVLSAFFFLLSLLAYTTYVERVRKREEVRDQKSEVGSQKPVRHFPGSIFYLLALVMFGLGLMSKPMLVTLPCVLLLLDYWPFQRLDLGVSKRNLRASLPL